MSYDIALIQAFTLIGFMFFLVYYLKKREYDEELEKERKRKEKDKEYDFGQMGDEIREIEIRSYLIGGLGSFWFVSASAKEIVILNNAGALDGLVSLATAFNRVFGIFILIYGIMLLYEMFDLTMNKFFRVGDQMEDEWGE